MWKFWGRWRRLQEAGPAPCPDREPPLTIADLCRDDPESATALWCALQEECFAGGGYRASTVGLAFARGVVRGGQFVFPLLGDEARFEPVVRPAGCAPEWRRRP
jgi:hypothetical protein